MSKLKTFLLLFLVSTIFCSDFYLDSELLGRIEKEYGIYAKKRFELLSELLVSLKDKSDLEKLEAVNDFFNEVRYASDEKVYGQKDYWATPWEFLGRDRGDCEDYVISKYFILKYLGVDYRKLYFTYVRSTKFSEPHMVLTYFATPKSEPLILDNNNRKIFPASQRTDLTPIYNFNGDVLNRIGDNGEKSHKKWDELKLNMQRKKI
ncbi:MAG: transglutaminase-like cysteine peptidase [Sulfurimonas sp.]|uniref:transglutaminase-like cysteine peptidase n=1 Tax=Sulfurimonas sp. TaxID=2022749 RepID=UPI00262970B9|nr:transglutaminase-like cysteine peptidase [Sulfurimonas sp.]MDD5372350.1 transglutaminase-like cysteine peptidase [Sulfurimonas sp.]